MEIIASQVGAYGGKGRGNMRWRMRQTGTALARYIIRPSYSRETMTCIPQGSQVIYQSKDGKEEKAFHSLERPR